MVSACGSKDPAVLALAGETVRRSDFDRHVAAVEATGLEPLPPEVRRGLLESFLEQRALVIEARRRGLIAKDAPAAQEGEAVARLLVTAVPSVSVSEEEIVAWYASHAEEEATVERVTLRQILVGSLAEAREVRRLLGRDPRSFDTLARTRSKGPEAALGGYLGSFRRGELPVELEGAAFALPEGATSEPVESPFGYHVLRVEARQAVREVPLEEARDGIRERLMRARRDEKERAFLGKVDGQGQGES